MVMSDQIVPVMPEHSTNSLPTATLTACCLICLVGADMSSEPDHLDDIPSSDCEDNEEVAIDCVTVTLHRPKHLEMPQPSD